ncbi:MAG TPA: aspartate aminotransferase [Verrucomicrobia bacterium]|nr:MAG: aspartate aminotransferase [Lentisphaerae bacterium GWF2_57_35]HBA85200.1 aspartate aminotransferase [Verrucomicrobiota bacterium]
MKTGEKKESFAKRVHQMRPSCIREIMKAASSGKVISFAGGLPNPRLFPVEAIAESMAKVLEKNGRSALQYSSSEGFPPLREYVAEVLLRQRGIEAGPDDILIVNGSQQGLDLIGKVFIDPGDYVLMESPAYLSAIQAFELFEPRFVTVPMESDGPDVARLTAYLRRHAVKLLYAVPNFQNPTGRCYSADTREAVARQVRESGVMLVEDDPYRELRFEGNDLPPISLKAGENTVMMGSFSKVLSPGMRMGWVYARPSVLKHLLVAKQASDLCSSDLTQRVLYEFLTHHDMEAHVELLKTNYRRQRDRMLHGLRTLFPPGTEFTQPEGGMFIWVTLPGGISAETLLQTAASRGVVFAPGRSFFAAKPQADTMRLNFTNAEEEVMDRGMKILADALKELLP